ncbi:hypothetical protein K435DRAFT_655548, partial [Dendrothele bispora CBS 962.96]
SSTHNTRIERLWVEVGTQFVRAWKGFFLRLEHQHCLNRENPHHLWLLHFLFLESINQDCREFQKDWNAHPISGVGHDRSPNDLYFLGKLQHGAYKDDYRDVHPDALAEHYGVHGNRLQRQAHQTGAGHPEDEEDSESGDETEWEGIVGSDSDESEMDVDNDGATDTPRAFSPFTEDHHKFTVFVEALQSLRSQNQIPEGYGVCPEEWDNGEYPAFEVIRTGRHSTKELTVALPDEIWRPRAELWVQGLYLIEKLSYV